jgi:hypothetical protein
MTSSSGRTSVCLSALTLCSALADAAVSPQTLQELQSALSNKAAGAGTRAVTKGIDECSAVSKTIGSPTERYESIRSARKCLEQWSSTVTALYSAADTRASSLAVDQQAIDAATNEKKSQEKVEWGQKEFMGLSWAIGAGYAWGRGPTRIKSAEVVNGLVRIKEDVTDQPRVVLEAHYFFPSNHRLGYGPFGSVQAGSNGSDPVSFGAGIALGWKDGNGPGGFVLGIGYDWSSGVQVLGDGLTANSPLPSGETQVRYKTRSAGSLLLFVSRRFSLSGAPSD